jgi:hypothetical protein
MNTPAVGIGLVICVSAASGCERVEVGGRDSAEPTRVESAAFTDRFILEDSVVLEQPSEHPIVRISGIDTHSDGRIIIGDQSEGDVKLFDPRGKLLRVIGRKGKGPGEFMAPRWPRFDSAGRIYVADLTLNRIQRFSENGEYQNGVNLNGVSSLRGFEILRDGTYLLLAEAGPEGNVLLHTDTLGAFRAKYLPIAKVRPEGEPDDPAWATMRWFSLDARGQEAFVASTLSDSLWRVDLGSGKVSSSSLKFPGYARPTLPTRQNGDIDELFKWFYQFHMPSTVSVTARSVHLPFVQGILNFGDPTVLLHQVDGGEWEALTGSPPVIGASEDRIIAIMTPNQEQVILGFYREAAH